MKYEIENKKKIKYGYIGMNKFAAKPHHIPFNHNEYTIEIQKGLKKSTRLNTIRHEEAEEYAMKNRHERYHKAHNFALQFEKQHKPFPQNNEKVKLNQMGFRF